MRELLFHIPDKFCLVMAALLALQWGMAAIAPATTKGNPGLLLARLTAPVLAGVRALTPAGARPWLLACIGIFWLLALRVVWQVQLGAWGLLPGQIGP